MFTVFPIPGIDVDLRVVQSGSMYPTIRTGSLIAIQPIESPEVGEIITYQRSSRQTPITHRIIDTLIENGQIQYITKGDNNEFQDMEPVTKEMVLGRVSLVVPFIGYGINFARTPIGFTLLIIVPAALVVFDELKKIIQVLRNRNTKLDT